MNDSRQIMRRPLALIAAAYAAGIWLALYTGRGDWRWLLGGALAAAAGWAVCRYARWMALARCCMIMAGCLAGWAALGARLDDAAPDHLSRLMRRGRESLELRGRIAGNPVLTPGLGDAPGMWRFDLAVTALRRLPAWQPAQGRVCVRLPDTGAVQPRHGETWGLAGVLSDHLRLNAWRRQWTWQLDFQDGGIFPAAPASGVPDMDPSLLLDRRYELRADPAAAARLASEPADFIGYVLNLIFAARVRAGESLRQGLAQHPEVAAVLRALALGYRDELPPVARRRFVATGTSHLFAISGLHMALLALFIAGVLRLAGVSRLYWFFGVAPALLVFTIAVGAPASAVRGGLMAAIWFLGPAVGRRNDGISALAAAGLLILLASPGQLFAPGFLLSFIVVAGLISGVPMFHNELEPALDDPAGRTWPRRCAAGLCRQMRFYLVVAVVAWLASMPLIARWFNIWSPLTPLANLPVIPLATFMLGCAFTAIIAGFVHPALAACFNIINIPPVTILQTWLAFVQSLPFCQFYVKAPPVWAILCWYTGLALLCWPRFAGAARVLGATHGVGGVPAARRRMVWARWSAAVFLLLAWPAWNMLDNRAGCVRMLNADGVAVVLGRLPGAPASWQVNAGGRRHTRMTARLLDGAGLNRLDVWLFTGMSARHAGCALRLLEMADRPVRQVVHPADAARYRVFGEFAARMRELGVSVHAVDGPIARPAASGAYWRAMPAQPATAMAVDLAAGGWHLRVVPAELAGVDELQVHRVPVGGAGNAENTGTLSAPALTIKCAPHSFGAPLHGAPHAPTLNLAPGRAVTMDFTRHGIRLQWRGDPP